MIIYTWVVLLAIYSEHQHLISGKITTV